MRSRRATAIIALAAVIIGGLIATSPATAQASSPVAAVAGPSGPALAADLTQFRAGNIISDAVFYTSGTMTEAQIQAFLESKVRSCAAGNTCLKDYYDTSRSVDANAMCGAYSGGWRERASTIIYRVAQACGINPQVILVTLQKEQSLVTHTDPSATRYRIAMGQGCPDTAACDTRYYGFFNQVMGAAWQFKRYGNPPGTSNYFTWYPVGRTTNVLYNPNTACGSSPVYIENKATAALYYYTPYQPNAAALNAGYGLGDGCSAYGNRNFYNYFTDWFGSTQVPSNVCAQPSNPPSAGGEFVTTTALNGRAAPTTDCPVILRTLPQGSLVTRMATFDKWWYVRGDGGSYWVHSDYLTAAPPVNYTTTRVSGVDRYATAVEVSKAAYPSGTQTVLVASGTDYPDALAAGAAAGKAGAALLLTDPAGLPGSVATELTRLQPTRVVLVGGEARVSPAVRDAIAALVPGATIERIAGVNRYETSRLLAGAFFPTATSAYVVTGLNYPDAVVAAALGASTGAPVVLVEGNAGTVEQATIDRLKASGISKIIIAGSAASVSTGIETSLTGAGFAVRRIGGVDRYETSRLLNVDAYPTGAGSALFAMGTGFADALTGSVLAAKTRSPLFTTPATCMTSPSKNWLISSGVRTVTLVGGVPSLNEAVANSVRC